MKNAGTIAAVALTGLVAVKSGLVYEQTADFFVGAAQAESKTAANAAIEADEAETEAAPARAQDDMLPELLVDIAAEQEALEARRIELDNREAQIRLAQSAMEAQAAELETLRQELERLLDRSTRENTEDVARLVEIYKAMKPAQAANLLNEADLEVAVLVLATMPPRETGPILAQMQPVRARAISKIILERSRLPGDQKLVGIQID